jgi:hypothetical protein
VFDLYSSPYNPAYGATNYPVLEITSGSGGYVWNDATYTLKTTTASATSNIDSSITCVSTAELVFNTPVIFTGTTFGNIVAGTTYYVQLILSPTSFTISATRNGAIFVLTTVPSGTMTITQWEQDNVDRLWVTVNGYRVPSSALFINPDNNLSILTTISPSDEVIITNMIPSATPGELVYIQNVNKSNEPSVYRANTKTRTWLTEPLFNTDSVIYVNDVTRITDTVLQTVISPVAVNGITSIGLTADKRSISQVIVYNTTTATYVATANYSVVVENLAPILKITIGVSVGDSLVITTIVGNVLYINGEQIKFTTVDLANNTLSGLMRGANGTGEQTFIPINTEIFGILPANRLIDALYYTTWNSNDFNVVEGDPLQISNTVAAVFLNTDIT